MFRFSLGVALGLLLLIEPPTGPKPANAFCVFNCGPDITGEWENAPGTSGKLYASISKNGDTYIVKFTNPTGMLNGAFAGPYKDGLVMIGTMVGNLAVENDGQSLSIGGVKMVRRQK
jgi:hypothetical protein